MKITDLLQENAIRLNALASSKQEVLEQITGVPHDIASNTGKPNPSKKDK